LMLLMLIMIIAPLIVHISEKAGFVFIARLMAYVGYTWLGLIFLFVSSALSLELYRFSGPSSPKGLNLSATFFIPCFFNTGGIIFFNSCLRLFRGKTYSY
jgi:hypothetical protein